MKTIIPIVRGILEICLAIWLAIDWVNIPTVIIFLVVISSLLQGLNSILEGIKGKINNDLKNEIDKSKRLHSNYKNKGFQGKLKEALEKQKQGYSK